MRPCYIYAITHLASGRRYVGSTVVKSERWSDHRSTLRRNLHHCARLQAAWNKYGEAAFEFSVLEILETHDRSSRAAAELAAIAAIDCFNSLISDLGAMHFESCPATRAKIRAGHMKRISEDAEHKAWLSERGSKLVEWARKPENREKRGILTKEMWQDPNHRQRVSEKLAKHWETPGVREEHGKKVSAIKSTPEAKRRMSEMQKAKWADPNGGLRNRKQTRWADPEAKAAHSAKMKAIWTKRRLEKQQKEQESRERGEDA